jgi:target of rapamycin complex subunit LST8
MRNFDNAGVMVNCAVLHPNQCEIFFGDQQGRVRIWDLTTNEPRELYVDSDEIPFRSIAITRSAKKLVAGNNVGTCFIWEQ